MSAASFVYVATQDQLEVACNSMGDPIAIDTEFEWRKTYYPGASLYQFCSDGRTFLVDALVDLDLNRVRALLASDGHTKILHDMRQDWRLFTCLVDGPIRRCEDTRVASAFVGENSCIGYGEAVQVFLGVSVEKSQTTSKWLNRPLSAAQLQYAAEDVLYLTELWECLFGAMKDKGVDSWYREEMELLEGELAAWDEELHLRIGGFKGLSVQQLNVLRSLCDWREGVARKRNLPRTWIVSDQELLAIAKMPSLEGKRLEAVCSPQILRRYGTAIVETAWIGLNAPEGLREVKATGNVSSQLVDRVRADLKLHLQQVAGDLGIAVDFLASRRTIAKCVNSLVLMEDVSREVTRWRWDLYGTELRNALATQLERRPEDSASSVRAAG